MSDRIKSYKLQFLAFALAAGFVFVILVATTYAASNGDKDLYNNIVATLGALAVAIVVGSLTAHVILIVSGVKATAQESVESKLNQITADVDQMLAKKVKFWLPLEISEILNKKGFNPSIGMTHHYKKLKTTADDKATIFGNKLTESIIDEIRNNKGNNDQLKQDMDQTHIGVGLLKSSNPVDVSHGLGIFRSFLERQEPLEPFPKNEFKSYLEPCKSLYANDVSIRDMIDAISQKL